MWPSITLHGGEADRDSSASMLLAADQLLFTDGGAGSGTAAALNEAAEAADTAEANKGDSANPRKRKKSSRACDFCHLNHQPCDNSKPRCGYCIKHGKKACLYLRPQKKRGPAQGYRSALHTMRESAAAWGVATTLIPDLAPLVAGYLEKAEGRRLVKAIKDPQQQEHFIQAWQQSAVFKLFFSEDADGGDGGDGGDGDGAGDSYHGSGGGAGGDEQASDADSGRDARRRRTESVTESQNGLMAAPAPVPAPASAPAPTPAQAPPPPPTPASAAAAAAAAATRPRPKYVRPPPPLPRPPPPPTRPQSQPQLQHQPQAITHDTTFSLFEYHNAGPYTDATTATSTPTTQNHNVLQHNGGQNHDYSHHQHSNIYSQFDLGGGSSSSSSLPSDDAAASSSLADIMARDVAKSSNSFTNTLGLLGFAADETANDFQAMSYHNAADDGSANDDALLGSEMDQKAYYELLMGRSFR